MPGHLVTFAWLALVLSVALLERGAARRLGAGGLAVLVLGLGAAPLASAGAPAGFLTVTGALSLLGAAVCLAATLADARGRAAPRRASRLAAVASAAGAILLGAALVPLLESTGVLPVILLAVGLGAALAGVAWLARRSGAREALRRRARPDHTSVVAPSALGLLVWVVGLAAVALAPHVGPALLGAVLAAWGAWLFLPPATRRFPWAPVLVLVSLGAALWFLATIAGPEGLSFAAIPYLPLSPAAERLVAPLLIAPAWALAGLWPMRQPAGGVLTAPVGALLLLRLGLAAVPAGLAHWRAAFFPLIVLGTWHAALAGTRSGLAVAGAALGLASLHPAGLGGAVWLLAAGVLIELRRRGGDAVSARTSLCLRVGISLVAGWGALAVVTGGLRAEVVWTVLAAVGAGIGLALDRNGCEGPR